MKKIFSLSISVVLIISLFVLSACKSNDKEINVSVDSPSTSSQEADKSSSSQKADKSSSSQEVDNNESSDIMSSQAINTVTSSDSQNLIDADIQTGQDVIIDMGEEFFE